MEIKGTKSEQNVQNAFLRESMARNKYTYFALQAKNEGSEEIASLFEEMAKNEKEHAKVWFKLLNDGLGESTANLINAATEENKEWTNIYPEYAQIAREEGLEILAIMFENISEIEKDHEDMFNRMLEEIKNGRQAKERNINKKIYVCKFCGSLSTEPLSVCPVCEMENSFALRAGR